MRHFHQHGHGSGGDSPDMSPGLEARVPQAILDDLHPVVPGSMQVHTEWLLDAQRQGLPLACRAS